MHHLRIHAPPNMHVCRCTIHTYMHHKYTCAPYASLNTHVHHQTPPKIKIYLVGLPSALYDRPGQNERSCVESAVFVAFEVLFMKSAWKAYEKCMLFTKRPLARNCNPMFKVIPESKHIMQGTRYHTTIWTVYPSQIGKMITWWKYRVNQILKLSAGDLQEALTPMPTTLATLLRHDVITNWFCKINSHWFCQSFSFSHSVKTTGINHIAVLADSKKGIQTPFSSHPNLIDLHWQIYDGQPHIPWYDDKLHRWHHLLRQNSNWKIVPPWAAAAYAYFAHWV